MAGLSATKYAKFKAKAEKARPAKSKSLISTMDYSGIKIGDKWYQVVAVSDPVKGYPAWIDATSASKKRKTLEAFPGERVLVLRPE